MNSIISFWQRIRHLLTPSEYRQGRKVAMTVFLGALLDFAGLAALLPGLLFLLDGGDSRIKGVMCCLGAMAFILLKNTLMAVLTRYRSQFLLGLYRRLSLSLFRAYYHRGLLYIRERGSMRLGYEVNNLCFNLSFMVLDQLVGIAGELLLLIIVSVALTIYSPQMTLLLYAAFVPLGLVYAKLVHKRVKLYGKRDTEERRRQSQLVTETMQGYAELELNDAFPLQYSILDEGFTQLREDRLRLLLIRQAPLFLSEVSIVLGITLLVAFTEGDISTPAGVFSVAAFRLLPSMRHLMTAWTTAQNEMYSLEVVEKGLELETDEEMEKDAVMSEDRDSQSDAEDSKIEPMGFRHEINFRNLSFCYIEDQPVLNDFNATIAKGEYVGLSGPSGVGKTTLFNLLMGFFEPSSGMIAIDGVPLSADNRAAWQRHVGYVAQDIFVLRNTLARNIALGHEKVDEERVRRVLHQACLDEWLQDLPDGLNTMLGEGGCSLSGGQKQRLGIARALYKDADVLLMDEATSALDNETERSVNAMLRQLKQAHPGLTIMVIAHRESTLAYCDRIIRL
jgi:ABC-type multidrug transport system fused ATPase/permease subunit